MNVDLLGYAAAFLTTASFVPQAWKVIRTRETHALSLAMYVMFSSGVALWLAYGILLASWPLIVANCVTLLLALIILVMKLREKDPP